MSETNVVTDNNNKKLQCCFRPPLFERKIIQEPQTLTAVPLLFLRFLLTLLTLGFLGSTDESSFSNDHLRHDSFHKNCKKNSSSTHCSGTLSFQTDGENFLKRIQQRVSRFSSCLKRKIGYLRNSKKPKKHQLLSTNFIERRKLQTLEKDNKKPATPNKEQTNIIKNTNYVTKNITKPEKIYAAAKISSTNVTKIAGREKEIKINKTSRKISKLNNLTSNEPIRNRSSKTLVKKVKKIFTRVFLKFSKKETLSVQSMHSKNNISFASTSISSTAKNMTKKSNVEVEICTTPKSSLESMAPSCETNVSDIPSFETDISIEKTVITRGSSSVCESSIAATFDSQSIREKRESTPETSHSDKFCHGDHPQNEEEKISFKSLDFGEANKEDASNEKPVSYEEFHIARVQLRIESELPNLFQSMWEFPERIKVNWHQFLPNKPFRAFAFHDGKTRRNQKTTTPLESAV